MGQHLQHYGFCKLLPFSGKRPHEMRLDPYDVAVYLPTIQYLQNCIYSTAADGYSVYYTAN